MTITVASVPNAVEIQIADDGPGLSEQEQTVLSEGVETALIHGSGLGLWLVHWIVTSHDGVIETTVEEGTTMTITIPRSPGADETNTVTDLKRARDRYQASFQEAFDAMVLIDDEQRILEANPVAARLYGMDREKLLGRSIAEFLPEEFDLATAWEQFQTQGTDRDTVTVTGADSESRRVSYSATADVIPGQHLVVFREISGHGER